MASNELLKRIDERNYLTEREHREFLDRLNKDLEILEHIKVIIEKYDKGELGSFSFIRKVKEVVR